MIYNQIEYRHVGADASYVQYLYIIQNKINIQNKQQRGI
jgi:hypothetical protein